MGINRIFAGSDGESHLEERRVEEHPALGALTDIHEVRVQQFDGTRKRDFHPLPERRLIIIFPAKSRLAPVMAPGTCFEPATFDSWKT